MKKTIAEIVAENKDRALACGTPNELRKLGIELGFDNRSAFPRYKAALKSVCGIDYDAVRETANEQRAVKLSESVTHSVTLYSDAKARCERFAICGKNGKVVWYGRFFDGEGSEQSAAELGAALKAIWLASKIRNEVCQPGKTVCLNLLIDAQWLATLSGKASALSDAARKFNIALNVEWISGTTNPADQWTTASGFKKWSDNDLAALAVKVGDEPVQSEPVTEVQSELKTVTVAQEAAPEFDRGSADRTEWFAMMGAEWSKLRDDMKARGMSSSARDRKVNRLIMEWVAAGKPAMQTV